MAYQKKYFVEYRTLKQGSVLHTIELWQDTTDVLTAEEVKGAQSPFIVELPELDHKFQVVRGTGATISLLSATDMKFFSGLEHVDFREFKVLHYIDGVLNWCGYLNADMQSEPYDIDFNYLISTTANDGFALLDRYRFLQSDESKYTGIKSKWELLQICLNKLALPYIDIRIKIATTFTGFSGDTDKTILHESFVNCSNFYDEDGEAMTLREVLDSILAPYGAFICQSNASIYISDVHTMAGGGTIAFQQFNASTYAYVADVNFVAEKDVSSIGYFGTGHSIERAGGTNQQRVVYSPYQQKEIINESIITPEEFTTIPATFSTKDGYNYRTLSGHSIWQVSSPADFEESYLATGNERFVYLRLSRISNDISQFQLPTEKQSYLTVLSARLSDIISISGRRGKRYLDGLAIHVTGKILAKTKANPYDATYTSGEISLGSDKVVALLNNYACNIGDLYYDQSLNSWSTTPYFESYFQTSKNNEIISNQWNDLGVNGEGLLIKLGNIDDELLFNGYFNFQIWSNTKIRKQGGELLTNDLALDETWIRNLKFSLVNLDGSEIEDSDSEYIGKLNKLFSQEGEEIQLKTGSNSKFSDLGMIIRPDGDGYAVVTEWTRAGETYRIEELLLNSLCSNYRMNFITLINMNLKNEFGIMNVITDSTYLSGKKFMVKSANIDFAEYRNTVNLVEISEDVLDIVKE